MEPTSTRRGRSGLIINTYGQPDLEATARIIAPRIREMLLQQMEEKKLKEDTQLKEAGTSI